MRLKFTKMHGAGNDFIVLDGINQTINLSAENCRLLADRRFGIGADQILLVEQSPADGIDFRYRIFNADGAEVEQCGNGARAFVRFVVDKHLTTKSTIRVATMRGVITPTLHADGNISVDMGPPMFLANEVPFDATGLAEKQDGQDVLWPLNVNGKTIFFSVLSMGNPHAVHIVDSLDTADVAHNGPAIENDHRFPERVNVGFLEIVDRHHVRLRVHERGAGETLACGTGACAAVVAGIRRELLDSPVRVDMRGGELRVEWHGGDSSVVLSGPAVTVFEGEITI